MYELTYQKRVWKRDVWDWAWEVRYSYAGADDSYGRLVGRGRADTRREANAAILKAVKNDKAERNTPWKKVKETV